MANPNGMTLSEQHRLKSLVERGIYSWTDIGAMMHRHPESCRRTWNRIKNMELGSEDPLLDRLKRFHGDQARANVHDDGMLR